MTIEIKPGARVRGWRPELLVALMVANEVLGDLGVPAVVTSGPDGSHRLTSLHYSGQAFDLRSRHLHSQPAKALARKAMAERLGEDFDVLLEGLGTPNEHFHIEYQPKGE